MVFVKSLVTKAVVFYHTFITLKRFRLKEMFKIKTWELCPFTPNIYRLGRRQHDSWLLRIRLGLRRTPRLQALRFHLWKALSF
jgi:hypothetical protein